MIQAPESPTTLELQARYPLGPDEQQLTVDHRAEYTHALESPDTNTLGIIGYCARPGLDKESIILAEAAQVAEVADSSIGLSTSHRGPAWKPRSIPTDWHGEETTDPYGAYLTTRNEAAKYGHVAEEIGYERHLERYVPMLSFGWIGSRNVDNWDLVRKTALYDPNLPIGIKNGLDGNIGLAFAQVKMANVLRGDNTAPAVLIYRGGENAQDPPSWIEKYLEALEMTNGRLIVDTAHGTEMAFDPDGEFKKSIGGQILALETIVELASDGHLPAGIIMEASEIKSPTDPHMPLDIALEGLKSIHKLKNPVVEV